MSVYGIGLLPGSMNVGSSPIIAALAERAGIVRAAGVDAACRAAAAHHAHAAARALGRAFPAAASLAQIRAGLADGEELVRMAFVDGAAKRRDRTFGGDPGRRSRTAPPPPSDPERGLP